jgi:hemerythrin
MKPSDIRTELLLQHETIRERITATRAVAERCLAGEDARAELLQLLTRLTDAVRAHNAREEELMSRVFPELDAWGPVRHEVMNEEHILEHEKLVNALIATNGHSDGASVARVAIALFEDMAAHMAREEKVFLGADVLSDEEPPPDAFGG